MGVVFGVIGYFVGLIYVSSAQDWPMNIGVRGVAISQITDWDNFLIVGRIHNYSYLGAAIRSIITLIEQLSGLKHLRF